MSLGYYIDSLLLMLVARVYIWDKLLAIITYIKRWKLWQIEVGREQSPESSSRHSIKSPFLLFEGISQVH